MNEEVREAFEKYPYLKDLGILFVSQKEFEAFESGRKLRVDYGLSISEILLKEILSNDYYYSYVEDLFRSKKGEFAISFPIYGDTGTSIRYKKRDLMFGLIDYIDSNEITEEEQKRFKTLQSFATFQSMKDKYAEQVFPLKIDGIQYKIKGEDFIAVLSLNADEFDDLCFNKDIKEFRGIPKEHLIYATGRFVKDTKINDEYILPEEVIDRIDDILSNQIIDLEAISFHGDTIDDKYKQLKLDPKLKEKVLEGMDPNFTELEQELYIYIMMCKLLTYDEEYYAVGQKGPATYKHKEREYIEEINLDHNEVVCFEFDLIYSLFINEYGHPFHIDNKSFDNEYGEAHADLTFRSGKYLVFADPVTSILKGDMYNAKLGKKLAGLRCLNKNATTKEEFEEQLEHVYSYIKEREKRRRPLDDIISEYRESTDSIAPIPIVERFNIMLEKVRSADFATIDDYSYIMDLRRIMFSEQERNNNIAFTILRDPNPKDDSKEAVATAIFTINEKSFFDKDSPDQYFIYRPHEELRQISGSELLDLLAYGKLEYIREDDMNRVEIPGITSRRQ